MSPEEASVRTGLQTAPFVSAVTKARQLARMKRLATGLLVIVTLLFIIARSQHGAGLWGWVGAFAEAAMIGALADWFAVTALFKQPLGLPIPHTAIIPRNKDRLADSLGAFVRDKFLATDTLAHKLRACNPADRLAAWLQQPANAEVVGDKLVTLLAGVLDFVDDERVRNLLGDAIRQRLQKLDLSHAAGQILDALAEDRRHQDLLDAGLQKLALWLDDAEVQKSFAAMIVEVAGKEYPALLKAVGLFTDTDEFSQKVAVSIVHGIDRWLHDIGDDPNHPRRHAFDDTVAEFIHRLQSDATFQARINATKEELLAHPALAERLHGLWDELKSWLHQDLQRPDSHLRQRIKDTAAALGDTLASNQALRDSLDEHLDSALRALAGDLRDSLSRHISTTMRAWKDEDLVRELELSVGRDLQFIRLNGTVVGGLVGLAIYAGTQFSKQMN
jgi:uncharacterized membrane-anchored protein YjiN (DUF445 family)